MGGEVGLESSELRGDEDLKDGSGRDLPGADASYPWEIEAGGCESTAQGTRDEDGEGVERDGKRGVVDGERGRRLGRSRNDTSLSEEEAPGYECRL